MRHANLYEYASPLTLHQSATLPTYKWSAEAKKNHWLAGGGDKLPTST
jgi:hypothetical protein